MNKLFILHLAFFIGTISHAQYSYTNENSQPVGKTVNKITSDVNGNLVFTGTFDSNISFGSFSLATTNGSTAFIAKKWANGSYSWAKAIILNSIPGDASSVTVSGVSIDAAGNAYVTGSFRGKISFDNINLSSLKNGSYYTGDMFTAKISASGSFQWAKSAGTNLNISHSGSWEIGNSVTTDNAGNVYAVGRLADKVFLNTGSCDWIYPPNPYPHSISSCVYVVKFNSSGTKKWEKKYIDSQANGSNCQDIVYAKDVDSDGSNIYISGEIWGSVSFGNVTLNTGGMRNAFLLKLDANGSTIWATSVSNAHNGYDLADGKTLYLDKITNTLYLSGRYTKAVGGTLLFGVGGPTLTSPSFDGFNAKYSSNGTCLWATLTGGLSIGVTRHPNGNIVRMDKHNSHLGYLDTFSIKEILPADGSIVDVTTAEINFGSSLAWFRHAGIVSIPNGFSFCQYLTGTYDFGGITISSSSGPDRDIILVKYTMPPPSILSGVTNNHLNSEIEFYPNPVKNEITLRNTNDERLGEVIIYNAFGKRFLQRFVSESEARIDVTKFASGIYFVVSDQHAILKFIKQ